ncbi:hypothetical protein [Phycicoccus avicenniae]|uniref:hypothetical protein n=1 Tax=Phycicoccus avicenniae TaxID=2828860 RepID=UPI003D2741B6
MEVAVALRERDGWVAACEERAAVAFSALTDGEGLSVAEALRWCGGLLSGQEAARLRRLMRGSTVDGGGGGAAGASPPSSGGQ